MILCLSLSLSLSLLFLLAPAPFWASQTTPCLIEAWAFLVAPSPASSAPATGQRCFFFSRKTQMDVYSTSLILIVQKNRIKTCNQAMTGIRQVDSNHFFCLGVGLKGSTKKDCSFCDHKRPHGKKLVVCSGNTSSCQSKHKEHRSQATVNQLAATVKQWKSI